MYAGFFELLGVDLLRSSGIYLSANEVVIGLWILAVRTMYGSSLDDDTIAADECSNFFIVVSHHNFIVVHFRDTLERDAFDRAMSNLEYDYIPWSL